MKVRKLETELLRKQQDLVKGLSLEVMAIGNKLVTQLESKLEGMEQRLISAEGQLKEMEPKLVKMIEGVEQVVLITSRNISTVKEAIDAMVGKKEKPIETAYSIELQGEAMDPLT